MKIKNTTKNKNKLLKLKIIKTKIYKKNYTFKQLKIEDIEHRLKKGLQIIYKYHINNKRILFISTSSTLEMKIKNLLTNVKHLFISQYFWLNGQISNKQQFLSKKISYNKISKLKNKSNLIVILDKLVDKNIIKESYKAKIPIIFLGDNLNIFETNSSYKIPGNFMLNRKKLRDNFFLVLLKGIIQKKVN